MDYGAGCRDVPIPNRPIASPSRVEPPVLFEPCHPSPSDRIDLSEIYQAAIPAVKKHALRMESARLGHGDQVPEMVILGLAIIRLVIDPVIARQVGARHRSKAASASRSL